MSSITKHGGRIRRKLLSDYTRQRSSFMSTQDGFNASSALFRAYNGDIKLSPDIFLALEYDDEPMPKITGTGDLRAEIGEKFVGGDDSGGWTKETLREAMHSSQKRVTLGDLGVEGENKDENVPGLYMPICKVVDGEPVTVYDSDLFPRNYYKWLYRLAFDVREINWEKVASYGVLPESDEVFRENELTGLSLSSLYERKDPAAILETFGIPREGLSRNRLFVKAAIVHYHNGDLLETDAKVVKHIKPLLSLIDNGEDQDRPFYKYVLESALFLDCKGAYDMITYAITRLGVDSDAMGDKYGGMYSECIHQLFPSTEEEADLYTMYIRAATLSPPEIFRVSRAAGSNLSESLEIHKSILGEIEKDKKMMRVADVLRTVIKSLQYRLDSKNAGKSAGERDYATDGVIHTAYLSNSEGVGSDANLLVIDGVEYPKNYVVNNKTPDKVEKMLLYAKSGSNTGISKQLSDYVDYWVGNRWRTSERSVSERSSAATAKGARGW